MPRKDVKPIAYALLERLGSLSNVLDAPAAELVKVDGVGETGATLLHLMPGLTRRYLRDRWGHKAQINTREDSVASSSTSSRRRPTKSSSSCCSLTKTTCSAHCRCEGSLASAPVYPRLVVEAALRHHAAKVVLAHNHPGGVAQPSDEDIAVTRTLVAV